ncbi:hypothetical protein F5B17DRAFT_452021 [Nemania serpens]|nr:hypothetical protein F5B17DRAFT_452021 [Nemania serpens]
MDALHLLTVDNLLVTADNPPRTDLVGMDHARCAALHNYLVHYAWLAEGRPPTSLHGNSNNTFFTAHGAAAEALRPRLDSSLAAFLATASLPPADAPEPAPFFFWAHGLSDPDCLFANETADLFDEPEDSLVCLYFPNIGQGGESGGGVLYHQGRHRAAVFMHMDDHDYALPAAAHPELWHPLETVLSNWIELIRLGKVVIAASSPRDAPAAFGGEKIGPWEWRPYGEAQVTACVGAWERLCDAVEARALSLEPSSSSSTRVTELRPQPLLAPAALDAASVPENCFTRDFLTRARRPRFRRVASGLVLPSADAGEFAASQPFSRLPRAANSIPPVCLFPMAAREGGRGGGERDEVDLTGSRNPFCGAFRAGPAALSRVPAGVYSESVERDAYDNAEDGFRLLLPYSLEGDVDGRGFGAGEGAGARKSDGSFVTRGSTAELFQPGYKPFGGDYYRPQRLERLFDHWRGLVERGVWVVGPEGVEGDIDGFKEADTSRWRDYIISPTW